MGKGVNRVIILGTCGQDPATKYTASGAAITEISVATESQWKDKQTGEMQKETAWHRITFFGKLAEIVGQYVKKGKQVYIEGRLKYENLEKDGVKQYFTNIIGEEMQLLGSNDSRESSAPPQRQQPAQRSQQNVPPPQDDFDGSIPF
jgi:single-strand DNA-binding protein